LPPFRGSWRRRRPSQRRFRHTEPSSSQRRRLRAGIVVEAARFLGWSRTADRVAAKPAILDLLVASRLSLWAVHSSNRPARRPSRGDITVLGSSTGRRGRQVGRVRTGDSGPSRVDGRHRRRREGPEQPAPIWGVRPRLPMPAEGSSLTQNRRERQIPLSRRARNRPPLRGGASAGDRLSMYSCGRACAREGCGAGPAPTAGPVPPTRSRGCPGWGKSGILPQLDAGSHTDHTTSLESAGFRPRPARARRLASRDRRRGQGQGSGAACLQDRPYRCLGAGRALPTHAVPAIWLPDPSVRAERERARFRLHLVRHRSSLKQRVHATLLTHGAPCPVSDLFGVSGRALLERLALPEPWAGGVEASLRLIDELEREIARLRARPAPARRRPPLPPAADDGPRDWLRARLHDRRRDRRDRAVRLAGLACRLQRPLPARLPGGPQTAAARSASRTPLPAPGAGRSGHHRLSSPPLPRALRADEATSRQAARTEGRPGRPRPPAERGDLAHADDVRVPASLTSMIVVSSSAGASRCWTTAFTCRSVRSPGQGPGGWRICTSRWKTIPRSPLSFSRRRRCSQPDASGSETGSKPPSRRCQRSFAHDGSAASSCWITSSASTTASSSWSPPAT
jgi:hypothetical protein